MLAAIIEPQANKSFLIQQFFKNVGEVQGEQPWSLPAGSEIPVPCFWHTERVVRKATAFRGGANKTAPPCETWTGNKHLATVPGEQLQRDITLQKILLLGRTIFSVRQKGVPPLLLPASMLQLPRCLVWTYNLNSHDFTLFEWDSFKKCNCSRKNRLQNRICFANVGYSPTPRQHFWKTAAPKNFLFACGLS